MNPTKKKPVITYSQVLCALANGASSLAMTSLMGYTSSALTSMKDDPHFQITEEEGSWIGTAVPGLALIGSLIAGQIVERFGIRKVALTAAVPFVLAWLFVAKSSSACEVIAARIVAGACLGLCKVATSVYVSESIHPSLRPKFAIVEVISALSGFGVINMVSSFLDWRGMAWVGALLTLPLMIIVFILPESPHFLLKMGKEKDALEIIRWQKYSLLKEDQDEALKEFNELKQIISSKDKASLEVAELLQPPYRWAFTMAVALHFFQQTSGIGVVMSFMGSILERSGSAVDTSTSSVLMTAVNVTCVFLTSRMMEKYSPKAILSASSRLMIGSLLILSFHFWLKGGRDAVGDDSLSFIPLACLLLYSFGFAIGWAHLPWMFIGDGLPAKIRGKGAGLAAAMNWACSFLVTKTYSWLTVTFGCTIVFVIYSLFLMLGMTVVSKYMPDTFGLSEIQLENYYRDSYKPKRQ